MRYEEYRATTESSEAKQAEARVSGVLRGGYVVADSFYYCGGHGFAHVRMAEVSELRYWPYEANG